MIKKKDIFNAMMRYAERRIIRGEWSPSRAASWSIDQEKTINKHWRQWKRDIDENHRQNMATIYIQAYNEEKS